MKETLRIINQMQADGVIGKYAIGGAVGATWYLQPSATLDVDIFVMLPGGSGSSLVDLSAIYKYLTALEYKAKGEHIVIGTWPVQFLPPANALEAEAVAAGVQTEVEGVRTWVMTAEHLAAIALQTGRPKDHARILQFLEQGAIDRNKMESIVMHHALMPKWEKFQRRYLGE
ncbi:MAG TPA: hypothetical protein VKY85_22350 [Candidatus Angelobacter sp.]|nr:hypothetical protein [Candidatus Angelobacter sp.]